MFTKHKFIKLDFKLQHKKCAEVVRSLYEEPVPNLEYYNSLLSWMKMLPFLSTDRKELADRYHYHLREAGLSLKEHNLLPHIRTGDRIAKKEFPEVAIYLDNIRSAYNVGSILRTTEALRIGQVHFGGNTPFIDNEKVIRTAMGAAELVPSFRRTALGSLPRPIIALDTSDEAIPVHSFIFPPVFTLILGNEEYGISKEALSHADYLIEVPMLGAKNSINVACAFAIAASEIRRQLTVR
jgi:tRNA G18 (ribose-2'-O)-methylase SpoU